MTCNGHTTEGVLVQPWHIMLLRGSQQLIARQ